MNGLNDVVATVAFNKNANQKQITIPGVSKTMLNDITSLQTGGKGRQ